MFALLRVGSSEAVLQRVGCVPSEILMCAIILCVGPMVAIPRTSASTFEMAIAPNLPGVSAVVFSVLFFALILALCIRESAVVDIVGKVLTPLLLAGLAAIIIKGIVTPLGTIAPEAQIDSAVVTGVKAGYQTMDALAALPFGILVLQSVVDKGLYRVRQEIPHHERVVHPRVRTAAGGLYGPCLSRRHRFRAVYQRDWPRTARHGHR